MRHRLLAIAAAASSLAFAALLPQLASASTKGFAPVRVTERRLAFRPNALNPLSVRKAYVCLSGCGRGFVIQVAVSQVRRTLEARSLLWVSVPRRRLARRLKLRLHDARLVVDLALRTPRPGPTQSLPTATAAGAPSPTIPSSAGSGCMPSFGSFEAGLWPSGCWRPYGPSSPFNQPLPANPAVLPSSGAVVTRMLGFGDPGNLVAGTADTPEDYGHPSYYSRPTDPWFTIHCTEPWGTCPIEGMSVQIPDAARPAGGSDAHLAVIDQADGWEYDFWEVTSKPRGGGTIDIGWGGRTRTGGDGLGSNATAAHFGLQAGIVRAQELESGQINHALFMTVKCTTGGYVYPAQGGGAACSDPTSAPAGGMRVQLAYTDAEIDALDVPVWKKTILRALAHYGAFIGDTGGPGIGFEFESGSTYTSFGYQDEMVKFAQTQPGVTVYNGQYVFNLANGVDWTRLRIIDPCVTRHTC